MNVNTALPDTVNGGYSALVSVEQMLKCLFKESFQKLSLQ